MKQWLSIFSAILAAAAVIGGVLAYNRHARNQEEARLAALMGMIKSVNTTVQLIAVTDGIFDNKMLRDHQLNQPGEFARLLNQSLPPRASRGELRHDFLEVCRMGINFIQVKAESEPHNTSLKDSLAWANEWEKRLDSALP